MIVGIDLGTTHSLIGAYGATGSRLFRNALGDVLTPSVVSLDDSGVLVGQAARERLVSHPQRTVSNFKRWMGSSRETRLGERTFRELPLSPEREQCVLDEDGTQRVVAGHDRLRVVLGAGTGRGAISDFDMISARAGGRDLRDAHDSFTGL